MAIAGTKRANWKTTIIGKYFHQEENYEVLGKCKKILTTDVVKLIYNGLDS
jgi:hypothetical protein